MKYVLLGTLSLEWASVRNHLAAVYGKLGVRNKPGLIRELSARTFDVGILPPLESPVRTAPIIRNLDKPGSPPPSVPSIAVMPFVTIGPAEGDYIGHGVAADVHHELTRCPDLLVSGRWRSPLR